MSYSYGKWTKYHMMKENSTLVGYLPKTLILTNTAFWELLEEKGAVVIKPSEGSQGYGVVLVSKIGEYRYELHSNRNKIICGKKDVEEFLDKEKYGRKLYIVQQKIPLATVGDCPFDLRVMVEREKDSIEWRVTGKLAKVAENGYFITNIAKSILSVDQALEQSNITDIDGPLLQTEIDNIALLTAYELGEYYPNTHLIGLDIGLTNSGDVYIIEANLKPSRAIFKRLEES
ncbi:YheC/YheD family protein [Bacillus sp. sid0103]|uniref:YheC/YheD family protein n=1 Tax=Bacillus sp. sid0103 TaxID=2856337 RepID=UPI001C471155|nr:YheC/YheD family protein [Bacillus sp. sid0103]MBV7504074.1 YheC/YheD family protein [Bacillus sp. sid0103]